jgi:hypothetical protein
MRAYTLIKYLATGERRLVVDSGDPERVYLSLPLFDLLAEMVEACCRSGQDQKLTNIEAELYDRGEIAMVPRAQVPTYVFVAQYFAFDQPAAETRELAKPERVFSRAYSSR